MRVAGRPRLLGAFVAIGLVAGQAAFVGVAGSASVRDAPPPTPVGPKGSLSPFVSVLHTPLDVTIAPDIAAPSAVLADLDTGQILFAQDPDQPRPIASVTKIMTALLVMQRASPAHLVTVSTRAAAPDGSNGLSELGLEEGERIGAGELTWALLLGSANDAAVALAEDVGGTVEGFVRLMNAQARNLGMTHTRFLSPSGLDDRGYSSARDLVVLTQAAFASSPRFARIVSSKTHEVPSPLGKPRHIQNRNALLWLYRGATGLKTGYTSKAGYCIVATAAREGRRLITVVLGDRGEPFSDAAALLNYGFSGFSPQRFVEPGEPLGAVGIIGGVVPAETGLGLTALAPISSAARSTRVVIIDPAAAYPPAAGERIGILKVSIPGRVLGTVPVVAADVPPPPSAGDRAWWSNAARTVIGTVSSVLGSFIG